MSLAVNTIEAGKQAGEHIVTILFTVAAIVAFYAAHKLTKKRKKPKLEDTLPSSWRDRFFS